MKIYFKIFGWLLYGASLVVYLFLWVEAFHYISDKIGSFLTFILIIITNVVGPLLYLVWHWIADGFPVDYFFIWLGALAALWLGSILVGIGDE